LQVVGSNSGAEFVISATDKTSAAFRSSQQNLDQTSQLAKQAGDAVGGIAAKFLVVTAAAAGLSYVAGEFTSIVKEVAALDDAAEITGASVENLSGALRALRPAGIGLDALTDASTKLVRAMSSADEETSKQGEAFSKLGINAKNSAGALKDPVLLLQELGVALNKYGDDANKTAIIQAILGKSGAQYLPLLKELGEAGKLQGNISTEQAAAAERLEKGWKNLSRQGQELRTSIANAVIPVLGDSITKFNQARAAGLGFFASLNTLPGSQGVTKKDQYDLALKKLGDLEVARKKLENGGIVDLDERLLGSGKNRAQLFDEKIQKQRELLAVYRTQGGDALVRQLPGVSLKDKAFYDAEAAKPSAPNLSKSKTGVIGDKKTDFQKDKETFAEIIALQDAQLKSTVELTRAQELQAKFEADLATGKKKYTAEQKGETAATIELIAAKDRELALKKLEKTSAEAVYQQQVAALETQLKANADSEKTLKETRDRIEEIGKEGAALLLLKDSRLAAADAALRERAALLLGGDRRGKDGIDLEPALNKERDLAAQQRTQALLETARQAELQNKQFADQIAQYGLTEAAIVRLKNAKVDEQLVILQTELARRQETEGMSESVKALERYQEALKNSKDLNEREAAMKRLVDTQRSVNELWMRGLEQLVFGGGKAKDVFKGMAIELAKINFKNLLDSIGKLSGGSSGGGDFLSGIFKLFGGDTPATAPATGSGVFAGLSGYEFAAGGVMTRFGKMPLNAYAGGGIANSPQVAIFGEGRMNEAFVPLPDGKRIPVDVRGSGSGSSVVINQTINVGEGVSLSQVQSAMQISKQQTLAEVSNQLRRGGQLRDQVRSL
jgi:hypothetical protein